MATLLAKNADVLVTMDGERRELRDAGLFARDGMIEQVGPSGELPETADTVLDLSGQILLPGLINCHHHLDQVLTRNLPAGQNTNLFPWLRAHYRVWAGRTPEDTRTAVDRRLRRAGAFGLHDGLRPRLRLPERLQGRRPDRRRGRDRRSLRRLARQHVARRVERRIAAGRLRRGRRRDLARLAAGDPAVPRPQARLDAADRAGAVLAVLGHRRSDARVGEAGPGVRGASCTPISAKRSTRSGTPSSTRGCGRWPTWRRWTGWATTSGTPTRVHVNDDEVRLFAQKGAGVCHCPSSNMRLASGIAPVKKYRDNGVKTGPRRRWLGQQRRLEPARRGARGDVAGAAEDRAAAARGTANRPLDLRPAARRASG